jgi:agmatinase
MIQLGIRASARTRGHWEQTQGVKQIWADEARALEPHALARLVVDHLEARGVSRVYISNDIDGTDARYAAACGTPEPDGLLPEHVLAVTEAVGECFHVIGADLVELAPGLSLDAKLSETSVQTAFEYVRGLLLAMRASPAPAPPPSAIPQE